MIKIKLIFFSYILKYFQTMTKGRDKEMKLNYTKKKKIICNGKKKKC